jgi:hypothetical protein
LRILIAVHSWWVSSAEADEFADRPLLRLMLLEIH